MCRLHADEVGEMALYWADKRRDELAVAEGVMSPVLHSQTIVQVKEELNRIHPAADMDSGMVAEKQAIVEDRLTHHDR